MRDYLDTKQAARRLGRSPVTLRKWRWQRKGPPYTKRGKVLYDASQLDAWIQAGLVDPAAKTPADADLIDNEENP